MTLYRVSALENEGINEVSVGISQLGGNDARRERLFAYTRNSLTMRDKFSAVCREYECRDTNTNT